MADFVESAKNMVSKAVSRTSWEAQKQMRVRGKQGEIDKLVDQRHRLLDELGQVAMNLYQQGTLSDPQLGRICAGIMELDHDVKNREEQLQELKKEPFPADQSAPGPVTDYSPPAYTPSSPSSPPPSASPRQSGGPAPAAQGQTVCPTCGSTVRSNSLYCRSCGTKLR
ncbi:MAG TPA: zinc ribbon domain-containing protein [Ktedonobacteraceae bacterium]|nr:zinc ribbon domain-containing protein [Ktedonobacteraceae bacterium]